jgi:hypothetical protein
MLTAINMRSSGIPSLRGFFGLLFVSSGVLIATSFLSLGVRAAR